jgi:hypothetical protein
LLFGKNMTSSSRPLDPTPVVPALSLHPANRVAADLTSIN